MVNLSKQISDILQIGITNEHFPGVMYALVNSEGIILKNYLGYKQTYPQKEQLIGNELYDIASLTKVVSTTMIVLKCIEKGLLQLETKVNEVLPMFDFSNVTIEDLLLHQSGLPADIPNAKVLRNKNDVISKIKEVRLLYKPKEKIIYSDIGFILLGFIVEEITKTKLDVLAKKWIFNPLQMHDTTYHPSRNSVCPTEVRNDEVYQGLLVGLAHDEKAFALNNVAGHAGLFSTVFDISKYIQMVLRNDGKFLSKETINSLFVTKVKIDGKARSIGFEKPTKGGICHQFCNVDDTIFHTGFTGCLLVIDKDVDLGFVMLSNAVHPDRNKKNIHIYRKKVLKIIYEAIKAGENID